MNILVDALALLDYAVLKDTDAGNYSVASLVALQYLFTKGIRPPKFGIINEPYDLVVSCLPRNQFVCRGYVPWLFKREHHRQDIVVLHWVRRTSKGTVRSRRDQFVRAETTHDMTCRVKVISIHIARRN